MGDVQDLEMNMVQTVLGRMVELELARWLNNSLLTLKDDFGFNEDQLSEFARGFRARMNEQKSEQTQPTT